MKRTRLIVALFLVLFVAAIAGGCAGTKKEAAAPKYPTKQVNVIIAFTAGGSSDVQARIVEKYWKKQFNDQPMVFDYKVGAGGQVGVRRGTRGVRPETLTFCATFLCTPTPSFPYCDALCQVFKPDPFVPYLSPTTGLTDC